MTTEQTALQAFADSCEWEFAYVPQQTAGAKMSDLRLTWTVRVTRNRHTLESPYTAGIGHLPKEVGNWQRPSVYDAERIRYAVATGRVPIASPGSATSRPGEPINPNPVDVLACLALDASAIDYPTYEEWASELGYDPDSRSGEKAYRACIETALHLRRMFGDEFDALREAAAEW